MVRLGACWSVGRISGKRESDTGRDLPRLTRWPEAVDCSASERHPSQPDVCKFGSAGRRNLSGCGSTSVTMGTILLHPRGCAPRWKPDRLRTKQKKAAPRHHPGHRFLSRVWCTTPIRSLRSLCRSPSSTHGIQRSPPRPIPNYQDRSRLGSRCRSMELSQSTRTAPIISPRCCGKAKHSRIRRHNRFSTPDRAAIRRPSYCPRLGPPERDLEAPRRL